MYFNLYPTDPIPLCLYVAVKPHKPKNYPMGTIVSNIDTPMYGISKYVVEIIQPTLDKNEHNNFSSQSFHRSKNMGHRTRWKEKVSFDIVNLCPFFPLDKAIGVILGQLNNKFEDFKTRTK